MSENIPGVAPVKFKGSAGEWFGIWIVNLLLSIITIGIYSAWAKVRRKKYFYQNTYIAGRNFDYHATGPQILVGRLVIVGGYIGLQILSAVMPIVGAALLVMILLSVPWLIMRSLRFNARYSSWSNIRFGFAGTTLRAYLAYFIYPFLSALTLFTTWPLVDRFRSSYKYGGHRLGTSDFSFEGGAWGFYRAFLLTLAWVIFILGAMVILALPQAGSLDNLATDPDAALANLAIVGPLYILLILGLVPAGVIYSALIRNTVYNNVVLEGGHRFRSNVNAFRMLWIALSNLIVVVISLGLMLPWAHIRMTRYLAGHTLALPVGDLDHFVSDEQSKAGPVGDAFTDFEGIDVGI